MLESFSQKFAQYKYIQNIKNLIFNIKYIIMFKVLQSRFGFCINYTNFCVGNKVLHKFYHGDSTFILSDAIIKELRTLEGKQKIDNDVLQKNIDAFIPNKGIDIDQLGSSLQQRQKKATNVIGNFAISPHPIVIPKLMKLMHNQKAYTKLLSPDPGSSINYLLGSRGISKSTSFLVLKYFHNMRIPYIINKDKFQGQIKSVFQKDLKVFYFECMKQKTQVIDQIYDEFLKDFPSQISQKYRPTQQIKNSNQAFGNWVYSIVRQYKQKNVLVKLIVDQCNVLYNDLIQYEKNILYWKQISRRFTSPTILVASMDNNYLPNLKDPIIRIAKQNTQQLTKIILDDQITPKQRIQYGIQCLIFQLRQKGFKVQQIQKILTNINQFPMTTHLSCRKYINGNIDKINKFINNSQNQLNIIQLINQSDAKILKTNFSAIKKQAKEQSQLRKQQEQRIATQTIGKLLVYYQKLKAKLIKYIFMKDIIQFNDNNKSEIIKLQGQQEITLVEFSQSLNEQIQMQNFTNFFFKQKSIQNSYNVYFCLINEQIKAVMYDLIFHANKKTLQLFKLMFSSSDFQYILNKLKGQIYEAYIIQILKKQKGQIYIKLQNKKLVPTKLIQFNWVEKAVLPKFNNDAFQKLSQQNPRKILMFQQQIDKMCLAGGQWFQTQLSNMVFDFLMTKHEHNVTELYFIDASTGYDQIKKIQKFENLLLKQNEAFKFMINRLSKSALVKEIHVYYIILRPEKVINNFNDKDVSLQTVAPKMPKITKILALQLTLNVQFRIQNKNQSLFPVNPKKLELFQQIEQENKVDHAQKQQKKENLHKRKKTRREKNK